MNKNFKLAVIGGDGIGPEVVAKDLKSWMLSRPNMAQLFPKKTSI